MNRDNINRKKENRNTIAWLWAVRPEDKWKIFGMVLVQMILAGSSVFSAWLLRGIIDCAVDGNRSGFWNYCASLLLLTVAQLALRAVLRHLLESARSSLENYFKGRLFGVLLRKDYAAVTSVHSGEWMNRLTSDTAVVADGMASILPEVLGMAVKLVGAIGLMLYLMPSLVTVISAGGLMLIVLTYAFRKVLKRLHKRIQEADGRLRVFLTERLSAMLIVRTFGKTEQAQQQAEEKMAAHRKARMDRNRFSNLCNIGFGAAMNGAYVLGAVYCGYGILTGSMSYGTFTAVLQLVGQIQSPFANITGYLPKYYAMLASAERLMEAESYKEDTPEPQLTEPEIQEFYENKLEAIGLEDAEFSYYEADSESAFRSGKGIGGAGGESVLGSGNSTESVDRKLTFHSGNNAECDSGRGATGNSLRVITGLNLRIQKGEYVAFVGHSGCGKSTVLKLLMSLYTLDSGSRYLEADGKKQPLTAKYRGLFAFVPQGNQLLSGTIREIIAFGDTDAMQEEGRMRQALQIACADEFVDALELGLDTVLGERGTGLSEGQMQRIAIARAIFSNHPILLLDEATSALDEETEARLLANLQSMTDRTVVIVTHRPAVLAICSRVVSFTGETEKA